MIKDFHKTKHKKKKKNGQFSILSFLCDILQLQVPQTVISYSEKLTHPNTHAESREKVKTLSHNILFL